MLMFTNGILPEGRGCEPGKCSERVAAFDYFQVGNFSDGKLFGLIGDGSRPSMGLRAESATWALGAYDGTGVRRYTRSLTFAPPDPHEHRTPMGATPCPGHPDLHLGFFLDL